jgi:hypothetical protein
VRVICRCWLCLVVMHSCVINVANVEEYKIGHRSGPDHDRNVKFHQKREIIILSSQLSSPFVTIFQVLRQMMWAVNTKCNHPSSEMSITSSSDAQVGEVACSILTPSASLPPMLPSFPTTCPTPTSATSLLSSSPSLSKMITGAQSSSEGKSKFVLVQAY